MRNIVKYLTIGLSAMVLIAGGVLLSNPLRRSEEQIRENLLKITPIGTNMEDVVQVVENNKDWTARGTFDSGYLMINGRPRQPSSYSSTVDNVVGASSMQVDIGEYRTIFATDVIVFYAFDEEFKLIDITVCKEVDSI